MLETVKPGKPRCTASSIVGKPIAAGSTQASAADISHMVTGGMISASAAGMPSVDVVAAGMPSVDVVAGDVPSDVVAGDMPSADVVAGDVPSADVVAGDMPLAEMTATTEVATTEVATATMPAAPMAAAARIGIDRQTQHAKCNARQEQSRPRRHRVFSR